jgi:hypothetical protein
VKCDSCRRPFTSADQLRRRAEYRRQGDGSVKVFGHGMPDGELAQASGQLVKVKHNGCYHADRKREQRG